MRTQPSHDYYRFINETWLNGTDIPLDAASTNISREIAEKIEKQLLEIVRTKLIQEPQSPLSRFVRSVYTTWDSPRQTEYVVVELIGALKNMPTKEDIGYMIGRLNRIQARSPITIKVTSDSFNTQYYRLQLSEYTPCVPYREFLLDNKYEARREKYKEFVNSIGSYFGLEELDGFVDIEQKVAKHLPTPTEEDNTEERYNLRTWDEIKLSYPEIPWASILAGIGASEEQIRKHSIIITNPAYLEHMRHYFTEGSDFSEIRLWLLGAAVLTFGRFISGEVYDYYFDFYGKELKGAKQKSHIDRIMISILTTHLPQLLSQEWVSRFVAPKVKTGALEMCDILKKAAIRRIRATDWMTLETQIKAIEKVNKMGFKVAYPSVWRDESKGLEFSETQMLRNLFAVNEQDTKWALEDIGLRERGRSAYWDASTYEVNAFYYPDSNEMYIPAGILQPPFFDTNKSMAWNLGGIGNVITHEMTHGFDSDGRKHDAEGNYSPWFTPEEDKEYEQRSAKIEKLFSVAYMGNNIDGKMTLMENIADLGGMSIALEALRLVMENKTAAERKKMLHEFFTSYAISWRNKDRKKKAELASRADKHAPPELRVNKIISQFPEFYEAYDVKPGDKLWVSDKDRITIW